MFFLPPFPLRNKILRAGKERDVVWLALGSVFLFRAQRKPVLLLSSLGEWEEGNVVSRLVLGSRLRR